MESATKVLQNNRRELKHASSPKFKSTNSNHAHYSLSKISKKKSKKEVDSYRKKIWRYRLFETIKRYFIYTVLIILLSWGAYFMFTW
ncbi:hypothetical protein [Flammeovirga pacifica]|nr:hypothetical protein [Flammeovirga pacifica]